MKYITLSAKQDTVNKKGILKKGTVNKEWLLVDAKDKILGRLCSKIAYVLKGKNKTNFTPHVDCGDNVVVINASKIQMTGSKMTKKQYLSHTGYPGGQKSITPIEILAKNPLRLIEKSVKGMLPKNRLGRKLFNNLFVYEGENHKHAAQKPKTIEFFNKN